MNNKYSILKLNFYEEEYAKRNILVAHSLDLEDAKKLMKILAEDSRADRKSTGFSIILDNSHEWREIIKKPENQELLKILNKEDIKFFSIPVLVGNGLGYDAVVCHFYIEAYSKSQALDIAYNLNHYELEKGGFITGVYDKQEWRLGTFVNEVSWDKAKGKIVDS